MAQLDYRPQGVCARMIHVDVDDASGVVREVSFEGGCNGNLKAISKLVAGMPAEKVVDILAGNTCGNRPTSCADQLTRALRAAIGEGTGR